MLNKNPFSSFISASTPFHSIICSELNYRFSLLIFDVVVSFFMFYWFQMHRIHCHGILSIYAVRQSTRPQMYPFREPFDYFVAECECNAVFIVPYDLCINFQESNVHHTQTHTYAYAYAARSMKGVKSTNFFICSVNCVFIKFV